MPRRRGKHVRLRECGKHVADRSAAVAWWDDDGSFSAALVVASCLGIGIASVIASGLLT